MCHRLICYASYTVRKKYNVILSITLYIGAVLQLFGKFQNKFKISLQNIPVSAVNSYADEHHLTLVFCSLVRNISPENG